MNRMYMKKPILTILVLLFSFYLYAQLDSVNCQNFRTGKFSYKGEPYNGTIIKRSARRQIEINESGRKLIYQIDWVNDCEYNLTFLKVKKGNALQKRGDVINVKIIESTKYSYVYFAVFNGKEYSQTIWIVK